MDLEKDNERINWTKIKSHLNILNRVREVTVKYREGKKRKTFSHLFGHDLLVINMFERRHKEDVKQDVY